MNASQNKLKKCKYGLFSYQRGFICFIYLDKLSQDSDWEGRF